MRVYLLFFYLLVLGSSVFAQLNQTDARSRYLQAIVDYNRSLNSLQRAISNLPDNRLFEVR